MLAFNKAYVDAVNGSPYKAYFTIAGGGQSFIGEFCKFSGASKTLVGAEVPYDKAIMESLVGKLDSYASSEAARKMAVYGFNKCLFASYQPDFSIGIGVSGSIATDNERVGRKHKFYIAGHNHLFTKVIEVILDQGRTRLQEEEMIINLIFQFLISLCQINPLSNKKSDHWILEEEHFDTKIGVAPSDIQQLLMVEPKKFIDHFNKLKGRRAAIYSGSFNPLHEGHLKIKALAEEILGQEVILELPLTAVGKGQLDYISILERLDQIKKFHCIVSKLTTFREKTEEFIKSCDGIVFVVGCDTWNRIWAPEYCEDESLLSDYFKVMGVRFLVFPRSVPMRVGADIDTLVINDDRLKDFINPISSTEIRNMAKKI